MSASDRLLDQVVEASGLMPLIAPFTVSRLLITADVSPRDVTPADLRRALPDLERGLSVYLSGEELAEAARRLRELAA
jgi:hypothetical protein